MRKDWTVNEVKQLVNLVNEHGKSTAIKMFAEKSGRSQSSVRMKLTRINDNFVKLNEEAVIAAEDDQCLHCNDCEKEYKPGLLARIFAKLFIRH